MQNPRKKIKSKDGLKGKSQPEQESEPKPAPRKISRSVAIAYASYLASQLMYHKDQASLIEQKLRILNEKGVLSGGRVEEYGLPDLMRCKITEL